MSTKLTPRHLERWNALHLRLIVARGVFAACERRLRGQYGEFQPAWLTKVQRAELDQKRAAVHKVEEKIFALLDEVSPRNWRSGVPAHWVASELTWEDAIRPLGEPLSVVPPLAYGATEALR